MARQLDARISTQVPIGNLVSRRAQRQIRGRYEIEAVESISRTALRIRLYTTKYARDRDFNRPIETPPEVERIILDTGIITAPDFRKELHPPVIFNGQTLWWSITNYAGVEAQPIAELQGQYTRSVVTEEPDPEGPESRPVGPVNPIRTPKLAVPFNIRGSKATVIEQDSTEEIEQTTLAILRTPVGSHIDDPNLGLPDPSFGGASYEDVQEAVKRSEPRAVTVFTSDAIDEQYEQVVSVQLEERERSE